VYSCFGIFFTSRPSGLDANHRLLEDEKRRAAQGAWGARAMIGLRGLAPQDACWYGSR
jgi:hypothetical protein